MLGLRGGPTYLVDGCIAAHVEVVVLGRTVGIDTADKYHVNVGTTLGGKGYLGQMLAFASWLVGYGNLRAATLGCCLGDRGLVNRIDTVAVVKLKRDVFQQVGTFHRKGFSVGSGCGLFPSEFLFVDYNKALAQYHRGTGQSIGTTVRSGLGSLRQLIGNGT